MTDAERLRIIHVVPSLSRGGAERVCVDIVTGLDRCRFDPTVVSLSSICATPLESEVSANCIPLYHLQKPRGYNARAYWQLTCLLRAIAPDLIHTHLHVLPYVAPIALALGVRVIHTVHNVAEKESTGAVRLFNRVAFAGGVVPVAISSAVSSSVSRVYGIAKVRLIPNGVQLAPYRCNQGIRSAWRSRNGYREDEILVVAVGRLAPQKNHLLLISAFADLAASQYAVRLLIAGDGDRRSALQGEINALGLNCKITLLGDRNDIPSLLLSADVFVLTSDWEGHPLSVIEAMAAGLPVLATGVGGVTDLVRSDVHGILVRPGDKNALTASLRELIDSRLLRARLVSAGRSLALSSLSSERMVQGYEQLYAEMAHSSSPAPAVGSRL